MAKTMQPPVEEAEATEGEAQVEPSVEAFEKRVKKAISYLASANLAAVAALMQVAEIIVVPAEDQSVPTACLAQEGAGYKIYMNMGFCGQFDNKGIAGVLLHECLHHVFRHLEQPKFPNHQLAN